MYTTHYTLVTSNGTATGLAWDRTQQQRINPGVPDGWLFQTKQQVTKYQGGGTNAVDAGFLATDGEPVCAILSVVYDLEAYRRNQSDPTVEFEGASHPSRKLSRTYRAIPPLAWRNSPSKTLSRNLSRNLSSDPIIGRRGDGLLLCMLDQQSLHVSPSCMRLLRRLLQLMRCKSSHTSLVGSK